MSEMMSKDKNLTVEEAYKEYVLEGIRRAEEDFKNGRYCTVEESRKRILEKLRKRCESRNNQRSRR